MRVLVVGATGFLGGHVVRAFLDRGDSVTALVRSAGRAKADARLAGAAVRVAHAAAFPALEPHDAVVYAAGAYTEGQTADETARRCQEVYIDGVTTLSEQARRWGAHFLFLSGMSRFGTAPGRTEVDEDSPPGTLCVFGRHKRRSEEILASTPGLRWTALVPLELYGAGASSGYVPFLYRRVRAGRFVVLGAGTNRWSLCNVHNAVDALATLAPGEGRGTVLIADQRPTSQRALAGAIASALERPVRFPSLPRDLALALARISRVLPRRLAPLTEEEVRYRAGDLLLDTAKARRLGIVPAHGLQPGIDEAVRAWESAARGQERPELAHAKRIVRRGVNSAMHRARVARAARVDVPRLVNWDLTYACPMRCGHCYSESGRRASRQPPLERMMRVAEVLVGLSPVPEVVFTGGEPLLVREMPTLAGFLRDRGARLALYTSGAGLRPEVATQLTRLFHRIAVSIDADMPAVNDRIRGREGAYDSAVSALALLDRAARGTRVSLGIECTVVRSALPYLEGLARDLPRRFPRVDFVHFGAAIPTGLASEADYAARELLDVDELERLAQRTRELRSVAPLSVRVALMNNAAFLMSSEQIRQGRANDYIAKIEADGRLRAVDIYEGTVGHVLEEPFSVLWRRARERHDDPAFQGHLSGVRTMVDWARATRAIDRAYAAPDDLARLHAR